MAKEPESKDPGMGTNALLAAILDTDKKILASNLALVEAIKGSTAGFAALLKVETDSRDYLKQISDAITGGGDQHAFSVVVKQLADQVASKIIAQLKK